MKRTCALILVLLTLLAACSLLSGCLTGCGPDAREARALAKMAPQQRRDAFASMPPGKQVDVYLYAALKFEPGVMFSDEVANNWKSILPIVKERLASKSTGDGRRTQLLWLLATISQNYCSLENRKDVLAVAAEAVTTMDEANKQYAVEPLRRITHPSINKQLQPCE